MPLDRVGGGLIGPRRRVKPKPTATPQKPFAGAKPSTSPKPRPTRGGPVFLDPAARDRSSILSSFDQNANAIGQALMGSASYDVGRVRNRQGWQQNTLQPFAGSARSVFDREAGAAGDLGAALESAARQMGYGLQSDIGGKLSDIQAPGQAIDAAAGAQGRTGEGVAGAIHGLTGAEVGKLQSLGGAYSDFAGALPGIAGLAGDAAARDIAREASLRYAEEMAQLGPQRDAALRENERYWSERQYREGQDQYERLKDILAMRSEAEQTAYDRGQDRQAMAYKWATLDARTKDNLLSDRRTAQRIFLEQKRLGLTAQNQSFNQWAKQQSLLNDQQRIGISQQNANTSAYNANLSAARAGKPIIRGSPSTGLAVIDPFTGEELGYTPARGSAKSKVSKGQLKRAGEIADEAWNGKILSRKTDPATGELVIQREHFTYQEAMRQGLAEGIPLNVMQASLNRYWNPGNKSLKRGKKGGLFNPAWEEPGQGRPSKPYQVRNPKAAAAASGGVYGTTSRGLAAPLPGRGQAGSWGYADPEGQDGRHMAIDWFGDAGTAVVVPEGGTVIEAKYDPRRSGQVYGGTVKVRTADGRVWVFRHTNPQRGIRTGMRVPAGTPVGMIAPWTGSTHSHVELWKSEGGGYHAANMINPLSYLYGA